MFIRIRRLYINCYDCQVEKELGMKVKVERERDLFQELDALVKEI